MPREAPVALTSPPVRTYASPTGEGPPRNDTSAPARSSQRVSTSDSPPERVPPRRIGASLGRHPSTRTGGESDSSPDQVFRVNQSTRGLESQYPGPQDRPIIATGSGDHRSRGFARWSREGDRYCVVTPDFSRSRGGDLLLQTSTDFFETFNRGAQTTQSRSD